MNPCDCVAVTLFNVVLILFNVPVYFIALFTQLVKKCRGGKETVCLSRLTIAACHAMWWLTIKVCCWIRVNIVVEESKTTSLRSRKRSKVIIANHQSFMDTILMTSMFPIMTVVDIKMFVASTLTAMPFLGTIVLAAGHIEVPFKAGKTTDTSMQVDKTVIAQRMKMFSEHIQKGGFGAWFPEGRMNREDPKVVGMFRAGGFAIAEEEDVELWGMAWVGVTQCWPSSASVGGKPSRIDSRLFLICESTHAHLLEKGVSREQVGDSGEKARTFLADTTRDLIQECCDNMRSERMGRRGTEDYQKLQA
mmetsp:Transcript_38857/g.103180  ORF Transcript_38857/g.103180 Transcript_38857/m.103180 type:complete len:306 (-) Transcript_38857:101-1018(-)